MAASREVQIHAIERHLTALLTLQEWDRSGAIPVEVVDEAIAATKALPHGRRDGSLLRMLEGLREAP